MGTSTAVNNVGRVLSRAHPSKLSGVRRDADRAHQSRRSHTRLTGHVETPILHALANLEKLSDENATSWCDTIEDALNVYAATQANNLWAAISDAVTGYNDAHHPDTQAAAWRRHKCNASMWHTYVDVAPFPGCAITEQAVVTPLTSAACAGYRTCTKQYTQEASTTPIVAILLGATSSKVDAPSPHTMALFTVALRSIAKTVECGFRYTVYVGYDAGDAFYDTHDGQDTLMTWFRDNVQSRLQSRGIVINLVPVRVDNPIHKPGPVFNAIAWRAYEAGATFFFRINDDSMLVTSWTSAMACALCSLGAPYGVVGPVDSEHPTVLTHDFVHRTHMHIFDDYYPFQLTDWWLDDWITGVYGSARSIRLASAKVGWPGLARVG